ncbi:hypothetical protein ABW19_dt0203390 [Dactylella cylindrospora]|nr:hypothetical protein ABW19_dt0203390 [Dactylella cylindrospora]
MLKKYSIDGVDLDIEEPVNVGVPLRLLQRLDADMGKDFILTMAPVAAAMLPKGLAVSLSGFDYHELDKLAVSARRPNGKLVSWYNCQFYNGWGDANTQTFYDAIAILGKWEPSRIVLGVLDNSRNGGSGFVPLATLVRVIHQLRTNFPTFGGVIGWEYFNAGLEDGLEHPWQWVKAISNSLYDPFSPLGLDLVTLPLPKPASPWPSSLDILTEKGASYFEALKALNATNGDLALAQTQKA